MAHAAPAPAFIDVVDDHGINLTSGMPYFAMEEGSIGSGPGRVSLQRIYVENEGWTDNWSGGAYPVTDANNVTKMYVQFGGYSDSFSGSGTNWTSDKGDGASLVANADGSWTYRARDGAQITFHSQGTDNALDVAFAVQSCPGADASQCHVPTSITMPSGLKFTLGWDIQQGCTDPPTCNYTWWKHRLLNVTSSAGYRFDVSYSSNTVGLDAWHQRASVTFTRQNGAPSPLPTVSYAYPATATINVTDAAARTWVFTMAGLGRLKGIRRPGSATDNVSYTYPGPRLGGPVTSATKDGVTNTYAQSISGTLVTATVTNPLSQQTVVVSDTTIGRPTSYRDALNRTTSYLYDTDGRITRTTAPEGNYVTYAYDSRGNVTTVTQVAKAGSGLANVVTSANFDATCANVVKCNKPNSTTDARGKVTDYTYDAGHGGLLTVTRPAPSTGAVRPQTRYSYSQVTGAGGGSALYMLTGVSACQTTSSCTGAADETKVTTSYNSNLLPATVTRADGTGALSAATAMTYDAMGNLLTVDGPLAGTADTSRYRYDAARQLTGVTSPDPDGVGALKMRAVRLTYRPDGQVSKQELGTVNSQSDADWANFAPLQSIDVTFDTNSRPVQRKLSAGATAYALTQTSYDTLGRIDCAAVRMNTSAYASLPASACTLGTQGSFGPDRVSKATYDSAGQVTQVQIGVGTTDVSNERTLTYSDNGLVTSLNDANNNLTTYQYDGFDRLSKTFYPSAVKGAGTSSTTDYEQLTYDAGSNVTSRRLRDGTSIASTYDDLGRVTLKNLPGTEPDVTYSYDNLGRLTSATQTGNALSFTYDALSRNLTQVGPQGTVTSAWDIAGQRTQMTYPGTGLYVNYDYLTTGEVQKIRENGATTGSGVLATYAYDDLGNRTSLTYGNGVVQNYAYDPVSRLKTLTSDLSGTASDLTIGGSTTPIAYNPASQITSAPRSNDAYSFSGHAAVNRSYTTNGLNQYTAAGAASFTHDARGNLTSDGTRSFCYSSENLLTGSGGTCAAPTVSLAYDPFLRLYQVAGTTTSRFAYDRRNIIADYDQSNALLHRYVFGPGVDEPIVEYAGSGTTSRTFLSADERGSIIARSGGTGALVTANAYDEYGIPGSGNAGLFQYTGQAWISQLGVQYSKARMYSPTLGRFMQTDPIEYADNANLYAYVANDPVNLVDPLGLCDEAKNIGGCGEIIIGAPKVQKTYCEENFWACGSSGGIFDPPTYAPPGSEGGGGGGGEPQKEDPKKKPSLSCGNIVDIVAGTVLITGAKTGLGAIPEGVEAAEFLRIIGIVSRFKVALVSTGVAAVGLAGGSIAYYYLRPQIIDAICGK